MDTGGDIVVKTLKLNNEQFDKVIEHYRPYQISNANEYTSFRAKIGNTIITCYKTLTLAIQGVESSKMYSEISKLLDLEAEKDNPININLNLSVIGTDEVGTGDVFGGIVVTACFVPKDQILNLKRLGVKDSKQLSDKTILQLAPKLMKSLEYTYIYFDNSKYNSLYDPKNMNMNKIKAMLHNRCILKILEKKPAFDKIVIDGFTTKENYFRYLQDTEIFPDITLEEKGESKHVAIAAASIISRYIFLAYLNKISEVSGYVLLKGASTQASDLAKTIIQQKGEAFLSKIAKLNFKSIKRN